MRWGVLHTPSLLLRSQPAVWRTTFPLWILFWHDDWLLAPVSSVHQYIGTSVHRYIGTSVHPYISTSVHRYIGTSVHQYISTSVASLGPHKILNTSISPFKFVFFRINAICFYLTVSLCRPSWNRPQPHSRSWMVGFPNPQFSFLQSFRAGIGNIQPDYRYSP